MKCPFCDFADSRMQVHAHLAAGHADRVTMKKGDGETELSLTLECPACGQVAEKRVNPRGREPGFLEEFAREIRLVAFDILLYHMQADHPEALGLGPSSETEEELAS